MTDVDALLASEWSLDTLQVYADHLQLAGDPRGELVIIDLHAAREGSSIELLHRRRKALRAWLQLPRELDPTRGKWGMVKFAYGFVDDVRVEAIDTVLDSPAAPFVRGVTLLGKTPAIEHALTLLASQPRPWLTRLTIAPRFRGDPPNGAWGREAPNLNVAKGLIAALPRLERLELAGHRLLREFPHPALRSLRVAGLDALGSILQTRAPMIGVTELVLELAREPEAPVAAVRYPVMSVVPAASFPALVKLDLSHNEEQRGSPNAHLFDLLRRFDVAEQLHDLRLPSIRTENEAYSVQLLLERMPKLRRLEIVRSCGYVLRHPHAEIVIAPVPWPRIEWATGFVGFAVPGVRVEIRAALRDAVRLCERLFDGLDPQARAAWTELWSAATANERRTLPAATLRCALDALGYIDANRPGMKPWWLVREAVHEHDGDVTIAVYRSR